MGFDSPLGDKKKNVEMSVTKRHIKILLLLAAGLLAGCVREDPPTPETQEEIRLDASVWQMMQGAPSRRVSTYESATFPQNGESFKCFIYNGGATTLYNASEGSLVTWNSSTSKWEFNDGKHYWPASDALDFFAYMPTTIPSYITDMSDVASRVTYEAQNPQFKCTLPMKYESAYTDKESVAHDADGQTDDMKEFVYALKTGRTKALDGTNGVELSFAHPFARIKFQLAASHPDITINRITFKGLKSGGSCSFNGTTSTWSSLTPSGDVTTDFVMTLHGTEATFNSNPASPRQIGPDILMVPQTFAGDIEVNATWIDWGEPYPHNISTKISSQTWAAGTSYTYTFTITETDLWVDIAKFTEQW